MPFNGDFYTNSEEKAPSHDFYKQNMMQGGTLEGSWQMRQAYAKGNPTAGSDLATPEFKTSYSRDANQRMGPGTNALAYRGRGVSGTSPVPNPGESYNSKRYGSTGSKEELTVKRFFGAKGELEKSKESTPGKGSPGGQGSDGDMAIASNNNVKVGKNARQSGNQSGGANIQAGGDIDAGSSVGFGATNSGGGVQQIGGHNSRQTHNQFMFDPNHPAWGGDGNPKADKTKSDKPKDDKKSKDWKAEDMGGRDMGLPRKGEPGSNTGGMPSQYEGMGGDYDATGTGSGRVVKKTRRAGTPGQAEQPYPKPGKRKVGGQRPSWEQEDMGGRDMGLPRPGEPGSNTGGMPPQYTGMDQEVPPTTGLPTTSNTGATSEGPGFFGKMWNKVADRVMTAPGGGPINFNGNTYTRPEGSGPGSRVMGAIGNGDSPASARIQQVNPRGTYGHPMNGDFGGRGPNRRGPQTTRFGDMGMGVPMQGSVPNGVMPSQYEGMGGDYYAGGPQPGRFDVNPLTGGVRPDFGNPNYNGPSRHPQAPTPDFTFGMQSEVAPMMQNIGMADMEMKRQAFRQRSRRPGT